MQARGAEREPGAFELLRAGKPRIAASEVRDHKAVQFPATQAYKVVNCICISNSLILINLLVVHRVDGRDLSGSDG